MATIRRAHPEEAAAVAKLYLAARRAAEPDIPAMVHTDDETHAWIRGQLAGEIGSPDLVVWVAGSEGASERDDGLDAVMITDGDWLEQLYVAPDQTGQGIGSRLLDHAKAMSPGRLQLWTFQANADAQRFYERHGFVEAERTDGHANEEQAPDIRYVWARAPFGAPPAVHR